jgi:hypothetical protein
MKLTEEQIKNLKPLSEADITEDLWGRKVVVIDKDDEHRLEVFVVTAIDERHCEIHARDKDECRRFFMLAQLALIPEEPKEKSWVDEWPVGTEVVTENGLRGQVTRHVSAVKVFWDGICDSLYEKKEINFQKLLPETLTIEGKTYKKSDVVNALSGVEEVKE